MSVFETLSITLKDSMLCPKPSSALGVSQKGSLAVYLTPKRSITLDIAEQISASAASERTKSGEHQFVLFPDGEEQQQERPSSRKLQITARHRELHNT